eukprot:EC718907.1.p2 GENE.EC718907.1~~EC718907.1.p2  ORF type:complete len:62 (-),score=2.45 EC718907.1:184-369(-)
MMDMSRTDNGVRGLLLLLRFCHPTPPSHFTEALKNSNTGSQRMQTSNPKLPGFQVFTMGEG